MTYSEQIRKIRQELLVTQTELVGMLGVAFASVNRWENDHHEPTLKQKRAVKEFCTKKIIKWEVQ